MASSSSNSSNDIFVPPNITSLVTQLPQLDHPIIPALRTHDLLSIVETSEVCPSHFVIDNESKKPNFCYKFWISDMAEKMINLFWLGSLPLLLKRFSLLFMDRILHARRVWTHFANKFASNSRSRISHLKRQLHTLNQRSKNCSNYLLTAKSWADQLAAVGKNPSYHPFITPLEFCYKRSLNFIRRFFNAIAQFWALIECSCQDGPTWSQSGGFLHTKAKTTTLQ